MKPLYNLIYEFQKLMKKKVKNKKLKPPQGISLKLAEKIRQEEELKDHGGKLLSLQPPKIHSDKKHYTRKQKHKNENS